uniref:Uncharacterized protein n=1 Tax=Oryza glaberrima TaxID=4538 RepID=I1PN38_ORYGL
VARQRRRWESDSSPPSSFASSSPPASSSTIAPQLVTRQRISAGGGWRQGGAGGGRRSGCAQAATVAWRHTAGAWLATRRRGRRPARRRRDCAWRRPTAWRWLTTWRRTASKPDGYPSGMPVPDRHEHGNQTADQAMTNDSRCQTNGNNTKTFRLIFVVTNDSPEQIFKRTEGLKPTKQGVGSELVKNSREPGDRGTFIRELNPNVEHISHPHNIAGLNLASDY